MCIFRFSNYNMFVIIVLIGFIFYTLYSQYTSSLKHETMANQTENPPEKDPIVEKRAKYMEVLAKHEKERHFPYRYLKDDKGKLLPIVLVSAPFRDKKEQDLFDEYIENGIKIAGITAYKSFPRKITDKTGDGYKPETPFDYLGKIKNWFCCFRDPEFYGFDSSHHIIDISESDFYNAEDENAPKVDKKYDMLYVCFKDDDNCWKDGWNAINRNFKLAQECLPIMIDTFGLKVLVVGRLNCGLEKLYGDKIEIVDFLPWGEFQTKLRESKCLFIPNIYDASPRTVAEALIKDIPVLMNRSIVCGAKYIHYETGELFTDEHDITTSLEKLLEKQDKISPKKWWRENYSVSKMGKKCKDFLYKAYPDVLENVSEVSFFY